MTPTETEIDRAAQTLAAIARIDSLQGGIVEFDARDLAGGWWYEGHELRGDLAYVWAPVPATDVEGLEATARRYIEQGIEHRQSCLEQNARARAEPRSPSRLTGRELLNHVREDWGLDPLPE